MRVAFDRGIIRVKAINNKSFGTAKDNVLNILFEV